MILTSKENSPRSTPYLLFALSLLTTLATTVRIELTSNDPQIALSFETTGKHTFYVISSGTDDHEIELVVTNQGSVLFNKTGTDLQYSSNFGSSSISVTLKSTDGGARNVTFDFYSDEDPFIKIIDKKDMAVLESILSQVHRTMKTISLNQQFHIERDEAHKTTLQESESHIKWTGIVKIVFLLTSALVQLWIMKGFFKNSGGQSYHPVQGTQA